MWEKLGARGVLAVVLVLGAGMAAWPQNDAPDAAQQPGERERLRRERAEHLRELARQEAVGPVGVVIAAGGDGAARVLRIGGPPAPEMVPVRMYRTEDYLYVLRGYMLYQFVADDVLEQTAQVDLRTEEEQALPNAPPGPPGFVGPDPAMVPVELQFSDGGDFLFLLRGYMLRQYAAEGLELVAEFDLRTEEERNRPRPPRPEPGPIAPPGGG